jgi:hypothetical protein
MELVRGIHNLRERHRSNVVTIGNYDGVHRGHQHLLAAVRAKAKSLGLPATVVTFEPTPREYFEGDAAPARLMRLREKFEALPLYGIDRAVVLRFDRRMQSISAQEFVDRLLVSGLGTRHLVVGHDFHFARRREGDIATLREQGAVHGFSVEEVGDSRRRRARQQFAGTGSARPRRPAARGCAARPAVSHRGPRAARPATRRKLGYPPPTSHCTGRSCRCGVFSPCASAAQDWSTTRRW